MLDWNGKPSGRPHVTPIADLSLVRYFLLRLTLHLTLRHNWEGTKKKAGPTTWLVVLPRDLIVPFVTSQLDKGLRHTLADRRGRSQRRTFTRLSGIQLLIAVGETLTALGSCEA